MKKLILAAFTLLLLPLFALANDDIDCIWVRLSDGSSCCVLLNSDPEIIFDNGRVLVGDKSILLDEVVKYTFGCSTDLSNIEIISDNPEIKITDGYLVISNSASVESLVLSNLQGISFPIKIQTNPNGNAYVDISHLESNVYIFSFGNKHIKFIVK